MKRSALVLVLVAFGVVVSASHAQARPTSIVALRPQFCAMVTREAKANTNDKQLEACAALCDASKLDVSKLEDNVVDCAGWTDFESLNVNAATVGGGAAGDIGWTGVLTDFFVARLKAELLLYVQEKIANKLCDPDNKAVLRELLPNSCAALTGDHASLSALPAAARRDYEALPDTLLPYAFRLARKASETNQKKIETALCVGAVMPAAYRAMRKDGPVAALHSLAIAASPHEKCDAVIEDVRRVASWLETELEQRGCPTKPCELGFEKFISDDMKSLVAAAALGGVPRAVNLTATKLDSGRVDALTAKVQDLQKRAQEIQPLLIELIDLLRSFKEGDRSTELMDQLADRTMKIVAILISADEEARADLLLLGDAIAKFATARYWPGLLSLLSMETLDELFKKYDDTKAVWAQVLKWGGVLGNLAAAKSAEDAQKILEGVAAPLGSYRAYRDGSWHGFISGYAGITAGTDKPTDGGERANSIAPFLPVGFEVGHSLGSNLTFHALVSVIDLGAPAMARFDNHDVDASMGMDDEIKAGVESDFASVFAPGAFVSVGLFDSPVVIGGGVELLPHSVRRFACDSASPCSNTVDVTTVRGMIFLAVDLTAFPIF